LRGGLAAGGAASIALAYAGDGQAQHGDPAGHAAAQPRFASHAGSAAHMSGGAVGDVDTSGFDPSQYLIQFDWGRETKADDGRTVREWDVFAADKEIEVAPGVWYPAWTFNGQVPGPTFRCRAGDRLRFRFRNASSMPHTIHFHGIHPPKMDGVEPVVNVGEEFLYEFEAKPFGLHPYHCHVMPLKRHIHKGLYGAFIIDPQGGRPPVDQEFVMVMSGFDVDFDDQNDFYAVNAIPFHYQLHPIQIHVGEKIRVYLVNILEFDLINSFHLHANFFNYYPTGTSLTPGEYTDNIMQTQAQRGILEFTYKYPGLYMFHAHNTEFAELGWTGNFEVVA
jgi:FtsP/CotA-like multicopper oxidase with cupredoxin domain